MVKNKSSIWESSGDTWAVIKSLFITLIYVIVVTFVIFALGNAWCTEGVPVRKGVFCFVLFFVCLVEFIHKAWRGKVYLALIYWIFMCIALILLL